MKTYPYFTHSFFLVLATLFGFTAALKAQDPATLVQQLRAKLEGVHDYVATGEMKTNVSFLKVPAAEVSVYFRQPSQLKIKNDKGISLVPKGAVSISLGNLLGGKFQALDAGRDNVSGIPVRVIKLLPMDDNGEIVLTTIYVDEKRLLILRSKTTTRENGTHILDLDYGKYADRALPDRILFTFNTQEYKLPKGVTFDYDDGRDKKKSGEAREQRGRIEINYRKYIINKGIPDSVFQ
jgi:hypothetical protein